MLPNFICSAIGSGFSFMASSMLSAFNRLFAGASKRTSPAPGMERCRKHERHCNDIEAKEVM